MARWTGLSRVRRRNALLLAAALTGSSLLLNGSTASASGAAHQGPLIERFSNGNWVAASSPRLNSSFSLVGVSGTSAHDVWAVGFGNYGSGSLVLIEHWDGSSWRRMAAPSGICCGLEAVIAITPDDVWAGGAPFAHWNGKTWTTVAAPTGGIVAMDALGPNDVWAVGGDGQGNTLTEHWDGGASWSLVPSPSPPFSAGGGSLLQGVTMITTNDVWAVGYQTNQTTFANRVLVEHWDGSTWKIVRAPNFSQGDELNSVSGTSPSNVWAVGADLAGGGGSPIEHWDGTAWTLVPSPNSGGGLNSVSAVSPNVAWAVGGIDPGGGGFLTLVERWDGQRWTQVPSANPMRASSLNAVTTTGGALWAVGYEDVGD